MTHRKRKRSIFDLFGFDEEDLLLKPGLTEGGSGYSMSVTYDEDGRPLVKVETQGDVDTAKLRRDIEERYPGARIEGLEKQPLIRVVGEKEERKKKKEEARARKKPEKGPSIRVID